MFVYVKICDNLEIVRRLLKVLIKISRQKHQYLERTVHPKKWWPFTSFDKNGRLNQMFCMHKKREMETKIKNNCCFAQARYSLTKLCNIFDEAFFVDVSIYVLYRT